MTGMTGKFIDREIAAQTLISKFDDIDLPESHQDLNNCIKEFLQDVPYYDLVEIDEVPKTTNCRTCCADCQFIGLYLDVFACPDYIPIPNES